MFYVLLEDADDGEHKFKVTIINTLGGQTNHKKIIKFGAYGYDDYTKHKDDKRKDAYIARHKKNEDWDLSGIYTAGFWAKNILWNKKTIPQSIMDIENRFPNIKIIV